jgi:hypothetical protein
MRKKLGIGCGIFLGLAAVAAAAPFALGWTPTFAGPRSRFTVETLRAAHLADLPASATGFQAQASDTLFTSERHIRFQAPPVDIDAFLGSSPGLRGVKPEPSPTVRRRTYCIPEDAAQFRSTVTVDDDKHVVDIEVDRS